MTNLQNKVWYACYGSNLLEDRFLCYIKGGKPEGSSTHYEGCTDKSLPTDNEDFYISSELYFANRSSNWDDGGVAFIRTSFDPKARTLARIYLVTRGQLIDIARQETKTRAELTFDFEKSIETGSYIFKQRSWYGNLVFLGTQSEHPIFTLTNERDLQPFSKPSVGYIKTIVRGIRQCHNFDNITILDYLSTKSGIKGNISNDELLAIIEQ